MLLDVFQRKDYNRTVSSSVKRNDRMGLFVSLRKEKNLSANVYI